MGRVWVVPVLENMAQLSVAGDLVMFLVLLVFFFGGIVDNIQSRVLAFTELHSPGFQAVDGDLFQHRAQRRGAHQGTNNAGKRSGATESSGLGLFPVFCCSPRCRALAFARWLWC